MTKKIDLYLDIRDSSRFYKVSNWCSENLADNEYKFILISMFPFWYRVRFNCPKAHVTALLCY